MCFGRGKASMQIIFCVCFLYRQTACLGLSIERAVELTAARLQPALPGLQLRPCRTGQWGPLGGGAAECCRGLRHTRGPQQMIKHGALLFVILTLTTGSNR